MHGGRVNNSVFATMYTAPFERAVSQKLLVAGENWSQIWIRREKILQVQTNTLWFYVSCRRIFKVSRAMSWLKRSEVKKLPPCELDFTLPYSHGGTTEAAAVWIWHLESLCTRSRRAYKAVVVTIYTEAVYIRVRTVLIYTASVHIANSLNET